MTIHTIIKEVEKQFTRIMSANYSPEAENIVKIINKKTQRFETLMRELSLQQPPYDKEPYCFTALHQLFFLKRNQQPSPPSLSVIQEELNFFLTGFLESLTSNIHIRTELPTFYAQCSMGRLLQHMDTSSSFDPENYKSLESLAKVITPQPYRTEAPTSHPSHDSRRFPPPR